MHVLCCLSEHISLSEIIIFGALCEFSIDSYICAAAAPAVYQEVSSNALQTVPFVPGHPSGGGGVDGTPPPATPRASYYTSYSAALQQLHHDQAGVRLV
jgi:hypothetical protein